MITIMEQTEDFFEFIKKSKRKIIIYGAGTIGQKLSHYISDIECFCDKRAREIKNINGISVIELKDLAQFKEELCILVCAKKNKKIFNQICTEIENCAINAKVFDYFDNSSFLLYKKNNNTKKVKTKEKMKVNIIYNNDGWILGKFATKLEENLQKLGVEAKVSNFFDKEADVNHYIAYTIFTEMYQEDKFLNAVKTSMITHADCSAKLNLIKEQSERNAVGICMSRDTMEKLAAYGVPRDSICYINPAQDGNISPRKFTLGITHKTHTEIDYRKRTEVLIDICEQIDSTYFRFKIMGSGWKQIVEKIRNMGFEVEYFDEFDYDTYLQLMPSLDYYLFFGYDEGSMGYLDALAAGIETIVTPQGYHLDIPDGITYPCTNIKEFADTLNEIKNKREKRIKSIESWTWEAYTQKHLEIWNYLTGRENLKELLQNKHKYNDGIFSVFLDDIAEG